MKKVFKTISRLLLCGMVAFSLSACDKNNDPKPEDKDKTEEVVTPTDPETPENPDSPETPGTPENPQEPETPEEPNTPEEPQEPETPQVPKGFVDLGLSVYWAECNLGANTPEEYGDYYAWGETSTKRSYERYNSVTYGKSLAKLKSSGIVDGNGNLTANYDVAQKLGKGRMPTKAEFEELKKKCTWKWTSLNGHLVTGSNGNRIFLPAAGYHYTSSYCLSSQGHYWSSTAYDDSYGDYAYSLDFDLSNYDWYNHDDRHYGHSVRPVMDK